MKKMVLGVLVAMSVSAATAGLWEGLTDENYVSGPKITDRDMLGKAVVVLYFGDSEQMDSRAKRAEELWKGHDKKRFIAVGSIVGMEKEKALAAITKQKLSFPFYNNLKLSSDKEKRHPGEMLIVSQYGKVLIGTGIHGGNPRDFEEFLVNAITEVGMPPSVIPGVTLDKYKALKNKLKLGVNIKSTVKALEKDVAAAEKKTANAAQKAKAEEASAILSAIRDGKSEISDNITALTEVNPEEAYRLLSLYVKSFPDEAADNKDKLAELKTKAAEFKKQK